MPHFLYWYFESFNILLAPLRRILLHNFLSRFFARKAEDWRLANLIAGFGKFLHIIKFNGDISACKVERAKVLWKEAGARGIRMRELLLFGRPFDVYEAERIKDEALKFKEGNSELKSKILNPKPTLVFSGLPRPANYDDCNLDQMDDKVFLKDLFAQNNLPVPFGGVARNLRQAKKIFAQIQSRQNGGVPPPVIVKPRAGSRGRHSTTYIYTLTELIAAFKIAKQLCYWVVVEEQLFGPVYRATVINYELSGVLRGDAPKVLGDGVSTISELINIKNNSPHPGVKNITADQSLERFLFRQNLNLSSVLKSGQAVNLSEKIGVNYGGSSSEDFDICHPENKELFVRAAKLIADPIVGFDFIISDIQKSWREQKCGFLEANSLPFINLHHDPLLGSPRNIAARVWDMVGF